MKQLKAIVDFLKRRYLLIGATVVTILFLLSAWQLRSIVTLTPDAEYLRQRRQQLTSETISIDPDLIKAINNLRDVPIRLTIPGPSGNNPFSAN